MKLKLISALSAVAVLSTLAVSAASDKSTPELPKVTIVNPEEAIKAIEESGVIEVKLSKDRDAGLILGEDVIKAIAEATEPVTVVTESYKLEIDGSKLTENEKTALAKIDLNVFVNEDAASALTADEAKDFSTKNSALAGKDAPKMVVLGFNAANGHKWGVKVKFTFTAEQLGFVEEDVVANETTVSFAHFTDSGMIISWETKTFNADKTISIELDSQSSYAFIQSETAFYSSFDSNKNHKADTADLIILKRLIAKWADTSVYGVDNDGNEENYGDTEHVFPYADVDGNGDFTSIDLVLGKRLVVEYQSYAI